MKTDNAYHEPVLLKECVAGLAIRADGVYVDVTYGSGGHARSILKQLNANGHLYSFDQDEDAAQRIQSHENMTFSLCNFRHFHRFLKYYGVSKVDGVLADLGVSSHQLNTAERGFSFRFDAAMDMRMSRARHLNAQNVLNTYAEDRLVALLSEYGEVRNAKTLARAMVHRRKERPFGDAADLVAFLGNYRIGAHRKYLAQVFQALRMEVNEEIDALKDMLRAVEQVLAPGGRLVVLTYHSVEDRIVKQCIKGSGWRRNEWQGQGETDAQAHFRALHKKVIVPSAAEIHRNPRARSAKLRIAEKIG